ncbi:heavy-metal-associated domain-containing protein [Polaromonas sp. YR568]|uniref:heavy-metal-associated domain-containing protein n=1 Tax=Polaromonas sp. YR568 TaxID=1855301 RepID=UPI003137CF5E
MEFVVPNMSCGHCVKAITEAVKALDPKAEVAVDLPARKVTVESGSDRQAVVATLNEAGYPTK